MKRRMIVFILLICLALTGCSFLGIAEVGDASETDTEVEAVMPELDENGFPVYDWLEEGSMPEDREFTTGRFLYTEIVSGSAEGETEGTESAEGEAVEGEPAVSTPAEPELIGYRNDFFGLEYVLPAGWTMEIGTAQEGLSDFLKEGGTYRDLFAQSDHGISNVSVVIERLRVMHTEMMTAEDLLEEAAEQTEESLRAAGAEGIAVSSEVVQFLGQEQPCIWIEAELSGVKVYETQIFMIRGTYVANILAVSYGENYTGGILNSFRD